MINNLQRRIENGRSLESNQIPTTNSIRSPVKRGILKIGSAKPSPSRYLIAQLHTLEIRNLHHQRGLFALKNLSVFSCSRLERWNASVVCATNFLIIVYIGKPCCKDEGALFLLN